MIWPASSFSIAQKLIFEEVMNLSMFHETTFAPTRIINSGAIDMKWGGSGRYMGPNMDWKLEYVVGLYPFT